ncbi:acyl-CoA dehydrogenase/oxidase [Cladochytrium replicatum]|nr:acyl-CoA dehydrogenase/oxidase [Cladochytrium replicatum]
MSLANYSRADVALHNKDGDAWIIIDSFVYNVSDFAGLHPGGEKELLKFAGKDATDVFYSLHRQEVLRKFSKLRIGQIAGEKPAIVQAEIGTMSKVPWAENPAWMGFRSQYYKESHFRLREYMRKYVEEKVIPEALICEETGRRVSDELWKDMAKNNIHPMRLGPGPWLKGLKLPGDVKPEEFDYFHEAVIHEEYARAACRGFADGVGGGFVIGLPPVLRFGQPALQQRVAPAVLAGDKFIALAISEPYAGSDVAGIQCRAEKRGDHYVVNGVKKWITNGTFADYFSTAVLTDKGMTMLLIERGEGVTTKPIKTSYSPTAGTALVFFEDVKVPVANVLGKENQGFQVYNFNHERWVMAVASLRGTRLVLEECFKWAAQRRVFGKALTEQPVIRQKLASMVAQIETTQQYLDFLTFQMSSMDYSEASKKLGVPLALLKYQCTRVAHHVADEAVQIFGGRALTKTGMGRIIEGFQRTYKFDAILGGSEEILADLAVRQALKTFPNARL